MKLCSENIRFRYYTEDLLEQFDLKPEQTGLAGSAATGAANPGDYDIVFYGNNDELKRINRIIKKRHAEQKNTKDCSTATLPFQFVHKGTMIDAFFVYDRLVSHNLNTACIICENVSFQCVVTDDSMAMQAEPVLGVDADRFSYLIIVDAMFRAVFKKGDIIEGIGDLACWVHNGTKEKLMICKYPLQQIKDYQSFLDNPDYNFLVY